MEIPASLYSSMRFNFLYVDKYTFQNWAYPSSYIPYCMLRYVLKGDALFAIDGEEFEVHEGQVAYIPEGCYLSCYALSTEFSFISIRFTTTFRLENSDFLSEYFKIPRLTPQPSEEVLGYFTEVYHSATSKKASRMFRIRGNLELILAALVVEEPAMSSDDTHESESGFSLAGIRHRETRSSIKSDPRIQGIVEYIVAHPTEPLDSTSLCKLADISPSTLQRLFRQHTGKTPREFIKELRMVTAARRLLVTDERISSIAYELGFDNVPYFSRLFKSVYGVSPQLYRKISRE